MAINKIFRRLVPDLSSVLARFSVPVLICLVMFGFFIGDSQNFWGLVTALRERVYLAGFVGFFLSGGLYLMAESRDWPRMRAHVAAFAGAGTAALLVWMDPALHIERLFIIPACVLWVMVAAFLNRRAEFAAIWLFNARFLLALLLATIIGLVFSGSLSAIAASLDYLFGVHVRSMTYSQIWGTGVILVAPVYGLSLIPSKLDEKFDLSAGDDLLHRGISVLINYILVPVLLIYVVILHAYALKIGINLKLPKGQIGIMVLLFGLGGTATWLIARPWVDSGTWLLRFFTRFWFWFTLVPVVLLALAVQARISAYGVTPERYGLVLLATWMVIMVVYFAIRRTGMRPQVILGSLALMLFVASFGSWGARGLSISSQMARLGNLMELWGITRNGKVVAQLPAYGDVPRQVYANGASIVSFLRKYNALDELKPYFDGVKDNPFRESNISDYALESRISERLRFRPSSLTKQGGRRISYYAHGQQSEKLAAGRILYGPMQLNNRNVHEKRGDENKIVAEIYKGNILVAYKHRQWRTKGRMVVEMADKARIARNGILKTEMKEENGGPPATLIIDNLSGEFGGKVNGVISLHGWLLLPAMP